MIFTVFAVDSVRSRGLAAHYGGGQQWLSVSVDVGSGAGTVTCQL
jgi:hypothetical protein